MFSKRIVPSLLLFFMFVLLFCSPSPVQAQDEDPDYEFGLAHCILLDHYHLKEEYPMIDFSAPVFEGALTLGGIAFTFDLMYVQAGSTWQVNFNDQFDLEATVDELGKAMVYYGLKSYGTYMYTSIIIDPQGQGTMEGPSGEVVVGGTETLDCSKDSLPASPLPATDTPEPTATFTPVPTKKPTLEIIEDDTKVAYAKEGMTIWDRIRRFNIWLYVCGFTSLFAILWGSWWYLRRRKPELIGKIRTKIKF